ncbi:MAG: glycosyltransferase family 4 protein, partial [Candidatus Altiarchaeales archaeon HGW-Altiarchaeales-3]
ALKLILKENINFDLIHAHFIYYAGYVGAKLKEKYKKPLIITGHGSDVYDLPFRFKNFEKMTKYALGNADYVTTVSKSNYEKLIELGVDKEKVTVIPNSYDKNIFKPIPEDCKDQLNIPKNKKIILSVGMLEEIKGHEYLIKAMRKVIDKKTDVLCIMVGSGQLKSKLQKLINDLDLEGYVRLVGAKPHDEIPLWMNASDLFVLPSLNEGNPTVMFECLGCGKPFVGTTVGGIPEVITNDKLGYLCEPKSPDELAEKILLALERKWDTKYVLNYAKKFSSDEIAKEIFKIYEKVID